MESLNTLIRNTKRLHSKIIDNATEVKIFDLKVETARRKSKYVDDTEDDTTDDEENENPPKKKNKFSKVIENVIFKAKAHALTDGKNVYWDIKVELFPVEEHFNVYNLPDLNTPCWVSCSCPYFTYFCEYAVAKAGSSEIHFSNGRRPVERNPNSVPIICKHLIASSRHVVPAMQKFAKTKETKIKFV